MIYTEFNKLQLKTIHQIVVNLVVRVSAKLSYFAPYSRYQSLLLDEVKSKRKLGWYYKQISQSLTERGFLSVNGKPLSAKLVERMEKKSLTKKERESNVTKEIKDIQVVFYE